MNTSYAFIRIHMYVHVCMHTCILITCIRHFTSQNCTYVELTYEHTYVVIHMYVRTYVHTI